MFCQHCGKEVNDNAVVCVHCGCSLLSSSNPLAKNRAVYVVLALFFGGLGVHNFYAGYIGKAVAQLSMSLLGLMLSFLLLLLHSCSVASVGRVILLILLCFLLLSIWIIADICIVDKDASGVPFG